MPLPSSKKSNRQSPAEWLATLADRHGVTPADLADLYLRNPAKGKEDGIRPDDLTPAVVRAAGGLFRAGVAQTLAKVDAHNTRVIKAHPELAESHESINGEVRVAKRKSTEATDTLTSKPPKRRGVEILGQPATAVIRLCARFGFSFGDARLAMDELGGRGIRDSTVHGYLNGGPAALAVEPAALDDAAQAELLAFKGRGKPEEEIKQERRAERSEERARQVVPMSAPAQQALSRFRR